MRLIILLAIVTTACATYLLHPLMKSKHAKINEMGTLKLFALPIAAILLYGLLGNPDIASRPALFEKSGPAHEYRAMIKKEMGLMRDLAENPQQAETMIKLGAVRLQTGRPEEAIHILRLARDQHPDDALIREELAAAHYAAALTALQTAQNTPQERAEITAHFKNALELARKDSLFRQQLQEDFEIFREIQN